jgi:tRNA nucleotidyltransferase (CCA-adding enzyme)
MGQALDEWTGDGEATSERAHEPLLDGADVLAGLRKLPGGRELFELAFGRDDVELVGGAVRDLLLGRTPRELDVVVTDDAQGFAGELARRVGSLAGENPDERFESTFHERFRTALVWWDRGRIDIATRRAESYADDGALPEVEEGTPEQDLKRRDFTVNAIAVPLGGLRKGQLREPPDLPALDDLRAGRLRVLHDASFTDDPTRLLRLARYAARLELEIEPHTAELAARAVAAHALDTVSGARIGAELRLALSEPDAVGALAAMDGLGLLTALHPLLRLDREMIERALVLLGEDGRPDLLTIAALTLALALRGGDDPRAEIAALLDRLEFAGTDRDRVAAAATAVPSLVEELPAAERPSRLRAAVAGIPPEGVALAGGASEPASEPARRWLAELRNVRLAITGDDLIAAGVPEGPEIGRRLERALELRLDSELADGREAELQAALDA